MSYAEDEGEKRINIVHEPVEQKNNIAGPCQFRPVEARCAFCIMDTSHLFSGLSIEAKRNLQQSLNLKQFNRGELLYNEGAASNYLYILLSGEVKIYKSLSNGKQQIHKLAQIPGDLIACEDLYLTNHGSSCEALNDVAVCYLKLNDLNNSIQCHKEISDALMQSMAYNLNAYIRHIANLGQKSALERLASYITYLSETHHDGELKACHLKNSLSRIELADMLGVTQRTLIRSIKQLEAKNYIDMKGNGIHILDRQSLEKIGSGL